MIAARKICNAIKEVTFAVGRGASMPKNEKDYYPK